MGPLSPLAGFGNDQEELLRLILAQQMQAANHPLPSATPPPRPTLGSLAGRGINALIPGESTRPGQIAGGVLDFLSTMIATQSPAGRFGLGLQESQRRQDASLAEQRRRSAEAQRGLSLSRAAQTQERLSKVQERKQKRLTARIENIARRKGSTFSRVPQSVLREAERLGVDAEGLFNQARLGQIKTQQEITKTGQEIFGGQFGLLDRSTGTFRFLDQLSPQEMAELNTGGIPRNLELTTLEQVRTGREAAPVLIDPSTGERLTEDTGQALRTTVGKSAQLREQIAQRQSRERLAQASQRGFDIQFDPETGRPISIAEGPAGELGRQRVQAIRQREMQKDLDVLRNTEPILFLIDRLEPLLETKQLGAVGGLRKGVQSGIAQIEAALTTSETFEGVRNQLMTTVGADVQAGVTSPSVAAKIVDPKLSRINFLATSLIYRHSLLFNQRVTDADFRNSEKALGLSGVLTDEVSVKNAMREFRAQVENERRNAFRRLNPDAPLPPPSGQTEQPPNDETESEVDRLIRQARNNDQGAIARLIELAGDPKTSKEDLKKIQSLVGN